MISNELTEAILSLLLSREFLFYPEASLKGLAESATG